jgi:hypothetical protein
MAEVEDIILAGDEAVDTSGVELFVTVLQM